MDRPTQQQYDSLLQVFRDQLSATGKHNYAQAADITGLPIEVVKRGWLKGWTNEPPALLAIRDVIERARIQARAKLARVQKKLLNQQVADAADAAADTAAQFAIETFATRQALLATQRILSQAAQLTHAAEPLLQQLVKDLALLAENPDAPMAQRMMALRDISEFTRTAMFIHKFYVENQDKILGRPDVTVLHKHESVPQGKEAVDNLLAFMQAMRRHAPPGTIPLLEPPPPIQVIDASVPEGAEVVVLGAEPLDE